jgi:tetratricopeptide (TPR) repeat protein
LLRFLLQEGAKWNVDADKTGLWTCSANARTGMQLAHKSDIVPVRALAVYYGGPDSLGQLRQDLPTLMVRAALDAQFLNTGIDNFIQSSLQQDARIEVINYLHGMHAFDIFTNTDESRAIIQQTVDFLKKNLESPVPLQKEITLTNKNFMWLILNNRLAEAVAAFRKARTVYRADSTFHPFYNAVIREDVLNANGYWLLRNQRQNDALEVFKLMVETYPESPNAHESLSETYETMGNKAEAIRHAETCLQKLPSATGMNEAFRQRVKQSAEERIKRLRNDSKDGSAMPPKRAHHELVYDEGNNKIILTAGSTPVDSGKSYRFFNDVWAFDGKKWKPQGTAGDERSGIKMAYDSKRHKIFSFGGYANNVSLAELRMLEKGEWKTLSSLPEMKAAEPGFVYDSHRDKLIAFGGSAGRGFVNGAMYEWNGREWKKFTDTVPEGRQAFAMVYDSKRKTTILFGGVDGNGKSFGDDVWKFDGSRWLKIKPRKSGPGPRTASGYTYDSKRGLMLIFGGISNGEWKGDTWSWNGKEWKQLATTGPSPRVMGYMAYDKKRDRVVLFGGRRGWPNDANDKWEWDGKKWVEIHNK